MTTTDVENTAAQLRLIVGQLSRQLRAETRGPATLPVPQAAALGWLDREGPMTTSQLAAAQAVRHQSASRVVGQLADRRMVVLRAHPSDGRKQVVHLTAAGRRALVRQREQRVEWLSDLITAKLTPAEQRTLAKGVDTLVALLER